MDKKILVIIPCYNEEDNIVNTVENLRATCPEVDFLVVNDCSTDSSAALLKNRHYPFLDLPGVIRRVEREGMVCATFRRKDGAWIRLQVMRYLPDEDEGGGTLWIFSAADADEQRA